MTLQERPAAHLPTTKQVSFHRALGPPRGPGEVGLLCQEHLPPRAPACTLCPRRQWPDFEGDMHCLGADMPCTQLWVPLPHHAPGNRPAPPPDRVQAPSPQGCLAGHLPRCTSQSYLGVQEPCSGGPLTRGSISEVQGSRRPGHRARWAPLAPLWGRLRGSMQTPRTGSGLGTGWAGISSG